MYGQQNVKIVNMRVYIYINNKGIFKLTPANKILIYFNSSIYKTSGNIASSLK